MMQLVSPTMRIISWLTRMRKGHDNFHHPLTRLIHHELGLITHVSGHQYFHLDRNRTRGYFICSCLPGIRPLVSTVHRKSGIDTLISRFTNSRTVPNHGSQIALGHPKGSHKAGLGLEVLSWG